MRRIGIGAVLAWFAVVGPAFGAGDETLTVHPASVAPFVALLLGIAILPLVAPHFWHSNFRRFLVAMACALPIVAYLYLLDGQGQPGMHRLAHSLIEYVDFIVLLGSLYVISGGVVVRGMLAPSPMVNGGFLLFGAMLANVVGTTGASMLLIRPVLRINAGRTRNGHIPIFFIFLVSNLGGLLTPLGDPPLFLGFLKGVDFFWTLSLWQPWAVGVGMVLGVFLVWDAIALAREPKDAAPDLPPAGPLGVAGSVNFLFLAGVLAAVLAQSDQVTGLFGLPKLERPWGAVAMVAMSVLSLLATPRALRRENEFGWGAIIEVAVLFLGIFVTMVPALALLEIEGPRLGVTQPWQYFWATGVLSSFLDNAPTYLTFATVAAEGQPFATLMTDKPLILQAISVGAVFMGANTYIGNGPNFMVKAIADDSGYRTPSFFGYMLYSGLILLPTFGVVTYLFFRPA